MPPRKPRQRKPSGPTPVESIQHTDTRANLPTADAQEFITPEVEQARQIIVGRDVALDPQLVWRNKYGDESPTAFVEAEELTADAPPIYIQEKIDPRVLIENLRRTAGTPEEEPELTLFDAFDGLEDLDLVDFYSHQANWSNRMILGDSLQVMGSLAEREELRGKVQMIYIDPPYGIKFGSNWQASARSRDVKDGRIADAAREAEQIKAFRDTWELGIHSYLSYLRDRLLVARELLTESGSCFVQIGDENVHLVRSLMDEVFGSENWISTIVVTKTSSATGEYIGGTVDYVHWYAMNREHTKYRGLLRAKAAGGDGSGMYTRVQLLDGTRRAASAAERSGLTAVPEGSRLFRHDNLTSQGMGRAKGEGAASWFSFELGGRTYRPSMQSRWKTNEQGMQRLLLADRVAPGRTMPAYVRFLDDFPAFPYSEIWNDIGGARDKTYVVETTPVILQRCMLMCTDPGDLVLDPTCGSGTTAYVAEQWGRRWITIDSSRVALALARQRLMGGKYPMYLLADSEKGRAAESKATGKVLPPAPTGNDIRHGFVYERVQHVTLKSIANNPDIKEGMTRQEIDEAIKRHADFELLYDKPFEDKGVVRVAGPFTVESLSPHRSLAFAGGPDQDESETERAGAEQPTGPNFEQGILDNLQRAGIQNGRKSERITFDTIETYPGLYIQAIGVSTGTAGGDNGSANGDELPEKKPLRVGIAIGPQYGTVSQKYARDAVHEAIQDGEIDLLCLLGFAFDAQTSEVTESDGVTVDTSSEGFAEVTGERAFGRIKLLFVRMNVDLLMGDDLKKTGAGNLFTVFGEPDIDVRTDGDDVVVELRGVDVYDPTTGEIRSNDTGQIALWMIDSDYNGDSFFVRHCYFTGGGDPYKRLKTALKADIDPDAWQSLYSTTSRPFPKPSSGRIAVKVINDYGDEVMSVFDVD